MIVAYSSAPIAILFQEPEKQAFQNCDSQHRTLRYIGGQRG